MAKCKRCGKKGLFLSVDKDGHCPDCAKAVLKEKQAAEDFLAKIEAEQKEMRQLFDEENKVLAIYNAANEQYKKDKDIDALIESYEKAFLNPTTDSVHIQFHKGNIKLAELYIRKKEYDKAWGYLNSLVLRDANYIASGKAEELGYDYFLGEVRMTQFKILKKEEKYIDAVETLMMGYVDEINENIPFKADKFEKDISTLAKKLNWDDEKVKILEELIISSSKQLNREGAVANKFRPIYKSWLS